MAKRKGEQPAPGATGVPAEQDSGSNWQQKAILWTAAVVVLIILFFILRAYLPRWWSHRVGGWIDGSMGSGVFIGLMFGFFCTLIPLLLLAAPFFGRWRLQKWPVLISVGLAVIVAIPNLLTLGIVVGDTSASQAARRTLDVDGPGFRGATLWGVIIGAIVAAVLIFYMQRYRSRGLKLKAHKEQERLATEQAKLAEHPPKHQPGPNAGPYPPQ